MKLLFLRGQVPQDRDPRQIMFDNIEDCDDMWTQLAYELSKQEMGEVWYWNGKRKVSYADNFIERWLPNFKITKYDFKPDVIFTRGGFKSYDPVLKRNPQAFKIYYGAGRRFYPKKMFSDYNLMLVDTQKQLNKVKKLFPNIKSDLIVKPVAENIFKPSQEQNKKYDIILVGNYNPRVDKGHDFAFTRIPKHYKVICAGIVPKKIRRKYLHIKFTGWIPRRDVSSLYAQSKIAVICCGTIDSCPRVIPEAIACNCPILVLDRIKFSHEKYISDETGLLTNEQNFNKDLEKTVKEYEKFSPNSYYKKKLSLQVSSNKILESIRR